jgi:hypothetical protein
VPVDVLFIHINDILAQFIVAQPIVPSIGATSYGLRLGEPADDSNAA